MLDSEMKPRPEQTLEEEPVDTKARLEIFGLEMIEKTVRHCGASGRIYLPSDWIDKRVKIIRTD